MSTFAEGPVEVGLRMPRNLFEREPSMLRAMVARAEAGGVDRLSTGDHVSFQGGQGFDGLMLSAVMATLSSRLSVQTAVYLLGLRHPVPVARQVTTVAQLAPGRFVFGVGVGGEDRSEWAACGVDPAGRGARVDESLAVVRALLTGRPVTHHGVNFTLDDALILPAPPVPVPIVVGGRSDAAMHRTATLGDGWIGLFVSAARYRDVVGQIAERAAEAGRTDVDWHHGMHVWCSFDPTPDRLAGAMEGLYKLPFAKFDRYSPAGSPAEVAARLQPYVDAGCRHFNLGPVSSSFEEDVDGVAEVKRLLNAP